MIGLLLLDFPKVTALDVVLVYGVTIWLNMLIYAGVGWIAAVGYLRAFQRN